MALTSNWALDNILRQTSTRQAMGQPGLSRDAISSALYATNLAEREEAFARASEQNRINEQKREFNTNTALKEKELEQQNKQFTTTSTQNQSQFETSNILKEKELAANIKAKEDATSSGLISGAVSGLGQLAIGVPTAYMAGKSLGLWGKETIKPGTDAIIKGYESQGIKKGTRILDNSPESMYNIVEPGTPDSMYATGNITRASSEGESAITTSAVEGFYNQPEISFSEGMFTEDPSLVSSGPTLLEGVTAAGAGIAVDYATQYGMEQLGIGGENERDYAGNMAGGATSGAMIAGPVGAVVGAAIGAITTFISDESVICTELNRQELLSNKDYNIESKYGLMIPYKCILGYHLLAKPIVNKMKKSKLFTNFIYQISKPLIKEMSHRVDSSYKKSYIGSIMLFVLEPICYAIGNELEVEVV